MIDKTNILEMCEETNPHRGCNFIEKWGEMASWLLAEVDGKHYKVCHNIDNNRLNYCPTCGAYIREVKIEKI